MKINLNRLCYCSVKFQKRRNNEKSNKIFICDFTCVKLK